eukprot:COSAG05_NODE_11066_length_532_cov_4.697460_1_plen_51_part_10
MDDVAESACSWPEKLRARARSSGKCSANYVGIGSSIMQLVEHVRGARLNAG